MRRQPDDGPLFANLAESPGPPPPPAVHFDGDTYEPAKDFARLTSQLERVRAVLCGNVDQWFTIGALVDQVGGTECGISARIRDLRKEKFGAHCVESRRSAGSRGLWQYRVRRTGAG